MEHNIKTFKEAVITIVENGKLTGVIYDDPVSRKKVMYSCAEMDGDTIASLVSGNSFAPNGRSE